MKILRYATPLLLAVLLSACTGLTPVDRAPTQAEQLLDQRIDTLVNDLLNDNHLTTMATAPAAVVPGSALTGEYFSRLEELVCKRLETRLRETHDIFRLSRQNWFELMDGKPLSFQNLPPDRRQVLATAVIYKVEITADTVLDRISCTICASGADGRSLPGIVASGPLGFGKESLARRLYYAAATRNPYPEGLEERPYKSLDRLAYNLTSELAEAYRNGLKIDGQTVADHEIKVLLSTTSASLPTGLTEEVQATLQQALIGQRGFTCVLSRRDFAEAMRQIDFYNWHAQAFKKLDLAKFEPGTILLLADVTRPRRNDLYSVALRAIWRTDPLEDQQGRLIAGNGSGTYVSGFTAKAYFSDHDLYYRYGNRRPRPATLPPSVRKPSPPHRARQPWSGPTNEINLCFYDFTEVLRNRIYPVLNQAPGVTWLRRADELCEQGSDCLCYELWYQGSREDLETWLRHYLKTSKSVDFYITSNGPGRLEVHFNGGFK
jgi:hypothetical protein